MSTEKTVPKQLTPWVPGQSGNPAGRPKGARSKLGEAFIEALHENFLAHGPETIETVRTEKPDQYLKVIASLMPKDINLNLSDPAEDLTDDQLIERIRTLSASLAPILAVGAGAHKNAAAAKAGKEKPPRVH